MEKILSQILPNVSKPQRYIGNELNIVHKDHRRIKVKFALAFPDVYEIGMSHLGIRILYHILNKRDDAVAERVFTPWIDMADEMRKYKILLYTLESKTPLNQFDVIGFSLLYELNYTNVLEMLDLAQIPLLANERVDFPIIIAGGPCTFNPEPLVDFIDAFAIGDGEEIIHNIADKIKIAKEASLSRRETLKLLSNIDGIYVPTIYDIARRGDNSFYKTEEMVLNSEKTQGEIKARIVKDLRLEDFPIVPIVPLTEIIHDRLTIEVMRGCTHGCRFCNAGYIYRPIRERSIDDVLFIAEEGIKNSGWEEISLTSLSTCDYSHLYELVIKLNERFSKDRVAVSLPSLRADSFTIKLAEKMKEVKKTGLTFAPEAGTARLRNVINKDINEDDFLRTVENAYSTGWNLIKLYFMMGLPTETDDDIKGIAELIKKVIDIGNKVGKGKSVNVSIAGFIPKPHTPFQWERFQTKDELNGKIKYLRSLIYSKKVDIKWHDFERSYWEAVFARGDRNLGKLLLRAWQLGCRFDSWNEQFKDNLWYKACEETGINPNIYLQEKNYNEPLPWDFITNGIRKQFLWNERERAVKGEITSDCRTSKCHNCGLSPKECLKFKNAELKMQNEESDGNRLSVISNQSSVIGNQDASIKRQVSSIKHQAPSIKSQPITYLLRLKYSKGEEIKYTSHLDLMRVFSRTFRRANIPIAYSQGFSPHPKIASSPPLPLGITSQAEYLDIQVIQDTRYRMQDSDICIALNKILPKGLYIISASEIPKETLSLTLSIKSFIYEITPPPIVDKEILKQVLVDFNSKDRFLITSKKGKTIDIRTLVNEISLDEESSTIRVNLSAEVNPKDLVKNVFEKLGTESVNNFDIEKIEAIIG